jgi:DNA-binding CsgD family transcriptional regulator/tetratricopeptide (TPR) repeat protein
VAQGLLEREAELDMLTAAVAEAGAGYGSVVLVVGEPGIGKTSLVRAFLASVGAGVRVLTGTCDDLLTPRTLGPLREAFHGTGGALGQALADGDRDAVYDAVLGALSAYRPTALVIEDIHWADDGTVDVLNFVASRLADLPVVIILTLRGVGLETGSPTGQLLGALANRSTRRLTLHPLSVEAVQGLAGATAQDGARLHALTGGNPFFVSEALGSPDDELPESVVDAVLARAARLSASSRRAVERLSVVPSHVEVDLATALVDGQLDGLVEAEVHGMLTTESGTVAFRHELARRAIESRLPELRRRAYNQAVVTALRERGSVDFARIVHHAVAAGDVDAIVAVAPQAGREAARAGSHRQALAYFEAVLEHADRLPENERAALVGDDAWELYNAHRFADAVSAGRQSVAMWEQLGNPVALGEALVALSRHLFMADSPEEARAAVEEAVEILDPTGALPSIAYAHAYRGALLALGDRPEEAVADLERARRLAQEAGRPDLDALCLNYLGLALADLGDARWEQQLRQSITLAYALGHHEYIARGYTNLCEVLYRFGRWTDLDRSLQEGLAFTLERDFRSHAYNLEVHRCLLLSHRGRWDEAERELRSLVDSVREPGLMSQYSVPALGRILARRGDESAGQMLAAAWEHATGHGSVLGLARAGIAYVEWAWLNGEPDRAAEVRDVLLPRTERAGAAPYRAELFRFLARAGLGGEPFDGCPEPYAAGLRGDWLRAAALWHEAGDPYAEALELVDSGDAEPMLEGLARLDALGAAPAASIARQRLRGLGVRRLPRGPQTATRANPAGLTERQVEVLLLLAEGLTNAEIADRLVVSVRTVDHHVSAILTRLALGSRREAAGKAAELGLLPSAAP